MNRRFCEVVSCIIDGCELVELSKFREVRARTAERSGA